MKERLSSQSHITAKSWTMRADAACITALVLFVLSALADDTGITGIKAAAGSASPNGTIVLTAVGDCTLANDDKVEGRSVAFHNVYNTQGPEYFLQNVRPLFAQDDLTIVNLECVMTTLGEREPAKDWCFRSDPSYLQILTSSSVEAVSFANNHCRDYGEISYTDTINNLNSYGIPFSSENYTTVLKINGIRVGLVSLQAAYRASDEDKDKEYYDTDELIRLTDQYLADVRAKGCDMVIMNYHWGIEKTSKITSQQTTLGHYAIDQGCDLVIGHHPHVLQPVELYNGKYIIYSLGNFCFGGNTNPKDKSTIIWQQTFRLSEGKIVCDNARIYPCSISSTDSVNDYCPTLLEGQKAQKIIGKMNRLSSSYGVSFQEDGVVSAN